jgi:hypothetical protein
MDRRGVLSLLGVTALGFTEARAFGSVARGLSLRDLVLKSKSAVLVTPLEKRSSWQTIGGSRRIVTETRARVEQLVSGTDPSAAEVLLQTLGGRVGNIGQLVEGEAEVALGEGCLTFLSELEPLVYRVTAMAQGHYPIASEDRGRVLRPSRSLPALLRTRDSAVERLSGKLVAEGIELVRAVRK